MPSAKPDKARLKEAIRKKGYTSEQIDFYNPIREAVLMACASGGLTQSGAANLDLLMHAYPDLDFFPYNLMREGLDKALAPNGWNESIERDLLILLTAMFPEHYCDNLYYLMKEDLPNFGDLYSRLFDTPIEPLDLKDRLCDFTGPFKGRSRRVCYEHVVSLGGTPSDTSCYTDYFFVADAHFDQRVISRGFESAILSRLTSGYPRIYRESAMPSPL